MPTPAPTAEARRYATHLHMGSGWPTMTLSIPQVRMEYGYWLRYGDPECRAMAYYCARNYRR